MTLVKPSQTEVRCDTCGVRSFVLDSGHTTGGAWRAVVDMWTGVTRHYCSARCVRKALSRGVS